VRQLDPDSNLMRRLRATPLPPNVQYTSISGTDDYVVPVNRTHLDGAQEVVVNVNGVLSDHTEIPHDPNAMRATRAALEGRPPPCASVLTAYRGAVTGVALSRFEGDLGQNIIDTLDFWRYSK
jgi:hypothetical protein